MKPISLNKTIRELKSLVYWMTHIQKNKPNEEDLKTLESAIVWLEVFSYFKKEGLWGV